MQIKSLKIENFRSINKAHLNFGPITTLIGENNSGKSTILRAIELFFEAAPSIDSDDFSKGHEDEPIEITITFDKLTDKEIDEFGSAVIDKELTIQRTITHEVKKSGLYSAQAMVFPGFSEIRDETNGTRRNSMYRRLREEIPELEPVSNSNEIDERLVQWEENNPGKLEPQWRRGFFGEQNVANGKLRKKTIARFIPAILDSSIHSDKRRSPLLTLLSDIATQTYQNRREISEFLEHAQEEFAGLTDPSRFSQLGQLSELLTNSIQTYYDDSKLMNRAGFPGGSNL